MRFADEAVVSDMPKPLAIGAQTHWNKMRVYRQRTNVAYTKMVCENINKFHSKFSKGIHRRLSTTKIRNISEKGVEYEK